MSHDFFKPIKFINFQRWNYYTVYTKIESTCSKIKRSKSTVPMMFGCFRFLRIFASFSSLLAMSPLAWDLFNFLMAQGDRAAPLRGDRSYKRTLTPEREHFQLHTLSNFILSKLLCRIRLYNWLDNIRGIYPYIIFILGRASQRYRVTKSSKAQQKLKKGSVGFMSTGWLQNYSLKAAWCMKPKKTRSSKKPFRSCPYLTK